VYEVDRVGLIQEEPGLLVRDEDRALAVNREARPCQFVSRAACPLEAPFDAVTSTPRDVELDEVCGHGPDRIGHCAHAKSRKPRDFAYEGC
jgi:hypothetical protein